MEVAAVTCLVLVTGWALSAKLSGHSKTSGLPLPPFVPLTDDEIYNTPVESMTAALRDHGPIVAIRRNGKIEYLVAQGYTRKVLTDESSFSFERGMEEILGFQWMRYLHAGTFFRDVDSIVREISTRRLEQIAAKIWPVFEHGTADLLDAAQPGEPIDILPFIKRTMARATILILLGPDYENEDSLNRILGITSDISELMGLRRHESSLALKFPRVWRLLTWAKVVFLQLPRHVGIPLIMKLWADISAREKSRDDGPDETMFSHLVTRYRSKDGSVSVSSKLWILVLIFTVVFGNIHQTSTIMVWVTYYLALHPDQQKSLHDEAICVTESVNGNTRSTLEAVQNAVLTDSFVREVLRYKGDSVNVARWSIREVELAGYRIPKGTALFPVTYLSNRSSDLIQDPDRFDATRWVGSNKSAATTGPDYLAFGLGRWSCPGRFLAVLEIKIWVLALLRCSAFELQDGQFKVVDAYNITAVPPLGRLFIKRREDTPKIRNGIATQD